MGKLISDEFERQLKAAVRWWKGQEAYSVHLDIPIRDATEIRVFRNNSGETVPAYAVMEVEDSEEDDGRNILVIKKPTGDATKPHVINGPRDVSSGKRGQWVWGTCKVKVSGTPSAGDEWGVTSSSWVLSSGGDAMFRMMGLLETGFAMGQPLV